MAFNPYRMLSVTFMHVLLARSLYRHLFIVMLIQHFSVRYD